MKNRSSTTETSQTAGYADWLAAAAAAADYIATRIAPQFGVSAEMIGKRLRAETLWPPNERESQP